MDKERIIKQLERIIGKERLSWDEETLSFYSKDMTENEPHMPDIVVKPTSVEEVQAIIKLANEERIPITPVVANTNVGGLAIPVSGGIVMDLKLMNNITEVNERAMYAIVEPGVTFGEMKKYLDENHPDFIFGYSLSPPYASVLCNCLMDGLSNMSLKYGTMSEWINGLEVVLPTGDIARTGAAAMSSSEQDVIGRNWFSRASLPDLTGLFVSWQGTTGIVTKMAIQVWPKPAKRRRMFLLAYDVKIACEMIRRFAKTAMFDDLGGLTFPVGKMLFGVQKPLESDPDEPEIFIYLDFSANTEKEMRLKEEIFDNTVEEFLKQGALLDGPIDIPELIRFNPEFERFAEFPMTLDFLQEHRGGGLTWVGTYGPTAKWEEGITGGGEIMKEHGFPPTIVLRPMKGGHLGVLRLISTFNKADADEIAKVRQLNSTLCDFVLDIGFIPYKAPAWAVPKILKRIDPNFVSLMKQIKRLLDPNGIMNPGRWQWD